MISTSKVIGSIDREVRSLTATMDECATRLIASYPESGLTVRRAPGRFIMQAGDVGVSVSLFRSRASTEASAEVVLGVWRGEVTLPGSTPRDGEHAVQLSAQQFHIVTHDEASWLWTDDDATDTMTSQALAAACVEAMAERLRQDAVESGAASA